MPWVVDTCVILDVAINDIQYGRISAHCLEFHRNAGLLTCPVSVVELGPQFGGDVGQLYEFLRAMQFDAYESWLREDTENSIVAWSRQIDQKRNGNSQKRPVADVLIGSFAMRFEGLITRNPDHFKKTFPKLRIIVPESKRKTSN
jgi:predicted nucleic acid-binding protein